MIPPSALGARRAERAVADNPEEPSRRPVRRRRLPRQLHERFLHDVLGRPAKLPRIEHQRRRMAVDELAEHCGAYRGHVRLRANVGTRFARA